MQMGNAFMSRKIEERKDDTWLVAATFRSIFNILTILLAGKNFSLY